MINKAIFIIFGLTLLVYLILPSPKSIRNFKPLSKSVISGEAGDTWQVPNVVAYFSNNYRHDVIPFYKQDYQTQVMQLPPFRLNYPPEFAYTAIKDQTQSTYLEELVYPMRDSLFINGMEPLYPEDHSPKFAGAIPFVAAGQQLDTKVTLRYYPSFVGFRLAVWAGVMASIYLLWKLSKKVIYA